ncbi:hypothetical protein [Escherichia coli]|uniref:hypothetical protein n=1 Tax=Escherichia coli TaxID=562 RepID=UPI0007E4ED4E|nr:hypothetical protein [Escherichia coli]
MTIEIENTTEQEVFDNRSIEQQVDNFIQDELQKLEQQKILARDNINRAKANAKREYLEHCKRHCVGAACNVMSQVEKLVREGWKVDLQTMQVLNGFMDIWLSPCDRDLKAGIRQAQKEAVQAYRLRMEVDRKNALEAIQKAAEQLYDRLVVGV